MATIDRLGWADGIAIEAYGVRVGVRVNDPEVLSLLSDRLPPVSKLRARSRAAHGKPPADAAVLVDRLYSLYVGGAGERRGVRRFNVLFSDLLRISRTSDLDELLDAFESHVHLFVAEQAQRRVFVHAGVVGFNGRAIVLPGRSFSGKTTMVAELVKAGATYYSDEYAVLDSHGRVHPYARPLQIRNGAEGQTRCPIEALGGRAGTKPLPVGVIVASQYKTNATWRPQQLSAGHSTLELLANAVAARRQPEAVIKTLRHVAAGATALKGTRGEAKDVVQAILRQLGT